MSAAQTAEARRTYRATARQKAREAGICVACYRNDVRTGKPRALKTKRAIVRAVELAKATGRATCHPCGVAANMRRKAAPARARGGPSVSADLQAVPESQTRSEGSIRGPSLAEIAESAEAEPGRVFSVRVRGGAPLPMAAVTIRDVLRADPRASEYLELA